ncbi:MAG: 50S ribosomal protein L30 [Chitinophagaceae bacterium]|nr:MAG: 50S ribosomal protein L30 [Chitinophagaceae bacterium]
MEKVRITQIKSQIDRPERQKRTLKALGLTRMHKTVEKENSPQIAGMIKKVEHLIKVEYL